MKFHLQKALSIRKKLMGCLVFICASTLTWIIINEPIFETFIPRAVTMRYDTHLIALYTIANTIASISCFVLAVLLFKLYNKLHKRNVPIVGIGYAWIFAVFFVTFGISRAMEVLNIYVTYYWIDVTVKLFLSFAVSSCAVAIGSGYKEMVNMQSPEEYKKLVDKIEELENLEKQVKDVH